MRKFSYWNLKSGIDGCPLCIEKNGWLGGICWRDAKRRVQHLPPRFMDGYCPTFLFSFGGRIAVACKTNPFKDVGRISIVKQCGWFCLHTQLRRLVIMTGGSCVNDIVAREWIWLILHAGANRNSEFFIFNDLTPEPAYMHVSLILDLNFGS